MVYKKNKKVTTCSLKSCLTQGKIWKRKRIALIRWKKTFAQSPKNCSQDLIEARHCLIYLIHKLTKRNHLTQIYLSWAMARHSRIWQTFNRECFSVANFSSANLRLRQSLPDPSLQLLDLHRRLGREWRPPAWPSSPRPSSESTPRCRKIFRGRNVSSRQRSEKNWSLAITD